MIFALLVLVVGAIVLVGWVQLMVTKTTFGDASQSGIEQRVALANSRALARQYILQQIPSGEIIATSVSVPWGGFVASSSFNLWSSTNTTNLSPFSPFERGGFNGTNQVVIRGISTIPNGTLVTNITTNRFVVRTRSPIAAGFPFVLQLLAANNGVVLPASYISYALPSGSQFVWTQTGFPQIPVSSRIQYAGAFNAPIPSQYPTTNIPTFQGYTNASATNLQIFINPGATTNTFLTYIPPVSFNASSSGLTNNSGNVIFPSNVPVRQLRIVGSTRTNALHIIIPNTNTNLTNILLEGNNTRPISVNRTGNTPLLLTRLGNANRNFEIAITLNGTPLTVASMSGNLRLRGGIRTTATITANASLILDPRTPSTDQLDYIADRMMWLENTRVP